MTMRMKTRTRTLREKKNSFCSQRIVYHTPTSMYSELDIVLLSREYSTQPAKHFHIQERALGFVSVY
jgi:hypothetical protein